MTEVPFQIAGGIGLFLIGMMLLTNGLVAFSGSALQQALARFTGTPFKAFLSGALITALVQSSTATTATLIGFVSAGFITFTQAITIHAKRTVLAHILFNAMTGLIAVLLLPMFLLLFESTDHWFSLRPGALSLAVFHSMFIGLGVLLFLPATAYFATIVQRILPHRNPVFTDHLDDTLVSLPEVALEASQRALEQISHSFLGHAENLLTLEPSTRNEVDLAQAKRLLDKTFSFVSRISIPAGDARFSAQRISQLHAIDHLIRLKNRLQDPTLTREAFEHPVCSNTLDTLNNMITRAQLGLAQKNLEGQLSLLSTEATTVAAHALEAREHVLTGLTTELSVHPSEVLLRVTDTLRWLERTAQHISRISYYLCEGRRGNPVSQSNS
ncbi:MAG: Na/Pi symporter [Burkholderiaceae bacterium]|nr:Na/Pi symporter [Burkholderiaceae bacterium]